MLAVLLTVHMFACLALVIAVMLQRSEGGALGMGGGGTGGIISGRGAASVLVRVTMGLAAVFFVTSIAMTRMNAVDQSAPGALERTVQQKNTSNPLDPLAPAPGGATTPDLPSPGSLTTPAAPVIDPLAPPTNGATPAPAPATTSATTPAPVTPAPAPAQPAPRASTTTTPKPAGPAATSPATTKPPATQAPTQPAAPPPENGGSNNQ
jgi:preprotein translocase subunit SecG